MSRINIQNCKEHGFDVVANVVSANSIQAFCDKYSSAYNPSEPHLSYLPSRDEFLKSIEIQNLLSLEVLDDFAKDLNKKLVFQLVEARLGSSQIGWHVDNFAQAHRKSDSYYSMIIALSDVGSNAGCFEVASGSHKFNRDLTIINIGNCTKSPQDCYKYFDDVVHELTKTSPIYQFRGNRGDIIIWSGSAIHRGTDGQNQGNKDDLTWLRNSLFAHFTLHDSIDANSLCTKLGYGDNLYFSTRSTSFTTPPPPAPIPTRRPNRDC